MTENCKGANIDRCADMAIELFDHSTQDLILIEEMSALTKALLKLRRGKSTMNDIAEEMAHVFISVEVVRRVLGIENVALEKEACKKLEKYGYGCAAFVIDETPIDEPTEMWPKENPYLSKETPNENH